MKEQIEHFTKMLDSELLDGLGFEKDKIACGYSYWRLTVEKFDIVVAPWTDGGRTEIHIYDNENDKTWSLERGYKGVVPRVTIEDLQRLLDIADVPLNILN